MGTGENYIAPNVQVNAPMEVGFGVILSAGDFNLKVRGGTSFAGGKKMKDYDGVKSLLNRQQAGGSGWTADDVAKNEVFANSKLMQTASFQRIENRNYIADGGGVASRDTIVTTTGWIENNKGTFDWALNVLPSYKVGNMTILLNAGIGFRHYPTQTIEAPVQVWNGSTYTNVVAGGVTQRESVTFKGKPGLYTDLTTISSVSELEKTLQKGNYEALKVVNADFDWFINPYIRVPAGGGTFMAGLKLYTDGTYKDVKYDYNRAFIKEAAEKGYDITGGSNVTGLSSTKQLVKWEIPIGMQWYF
jgi:hypothetical protein